MDILKRSSRVLIGWLKGDYSLWKTCWLTGVIPYMVMLQLHLSFYDIFIKEESQSYTAGMLPLVIDEICFMLYMPLCLIAIANAAIRYKGFHLWRFFAFLLFAKGAEIYCNAIMGEWPLGEIKIFATFLIVK